MTNNFDLIRSLLNFQNKGDFYFLQILKRRKDNPDLEKDMILIDNFFIYNLEQFDKYKDRIIEICDLNNARAYFRLNIRNDEKIALQTLSLIAQNIAGKNYNIRNCYLSVCGQYHSDTDKKWIIDLDGDQVNLKDDIKIFIEDLYKEQKKVCRIITEVPTRNGLHIICNPFDVMKFQKIFTDIMIHKDNPTILYQF